MSEKSVLGIDVYADPMCLIVRVRWADKIIETISGG